MKIWAMLNYDPNFGWNCCGTILDTAEPPSTHSHLIVRENSCIKLMALKSSKKHSEIQTYVLWNVV